MVDDNSRTLTVVERFSAICGEGTEIGQKAYFICLAGCNLLCQGWPCDAPHSWDPKFKEGWQRINVEYLAKEIEDKPRLFITGGEPLLQIVALRKLLQQYRRGGAGEVILQTNGTIDPGILVPFVDMISVDCKTPSSREKSSDQVITAILHHSHRITVQVKLLIRTEEDYRFAQERAWAVYRHTQAAKIVLGVANIHPTDEDVGRVHLLSFQREWVEQFLRDTWPPTTRFLPQWHTLLWGNTRRQ